jgi:hypothetical protein
MSKWELVLVWWWLCLSQYPRRCVATGGGYTVQTSSLCANGEAYLGEFQVLGTIRVPGSALALGTGYSGTPDTRRRLLATVGRDGVSRQGQAAKILAGGLPPGLGGLVGGLVDAFENDRLQDQVKDHLALVENNLREIAKNTLAIGANVNAVADNRDVLANLATDVVLLQDTFVNKINEVRADANRQFSAVQGALRLLGTRVQLLDLEAQASRQYTKRLFWLRNLESEIQAVLTDPMVSKFYQLAALWELRNLTYPSTRSEDGQTLYFYRPLSGLNHAEDDLSANPFLFTGQVCRMEARRIWSPRTFLSSRETVYYLEQAPVCYVVDTESRCFGYDPSNAGRRHPGFSYNVGNSTRTRIGVALDMIAFCFAGSQLDPMCDSEACDPRNMWHQLNRYANPDVTRARSRTTQIDPRTNFPTTVLCTADRVCVDGQGTCADDTGCRPPSVCTLGACPATGADGLPGFGDSSSCCSDVPSPGCIQNSANYRNGSEALPEPPGCCDSRTIAATGADPRTACQMVDMGGTTGIVGEGPCESHYDCAGTLTCSGPCFWDPVRPYRQGPHPASYGPRCCFDSILPQPACVVTETRTCESRVDQLGDGFTIFTSESLGPDPQYTNRALRLPFAQQRGVYPQQAFNPARHRRYATLFFDPMELIDVNFRRNLPPSLADYPDFSDLWTSGKGQGNLAFADYGPFLDVLVGRHTGTGAVRVVDPQYTQDSGVMLSFYHGAVATRGWAADSVSAPSCTQLVSDGGNFVELCCAMGAVPGMLNYSLALGDGADDLLAAETVLVEARSIGQMIQDMGPDMETEFNGMLAALTGNTSQLGDNLLDPIRSRLNRSASERRSAARDLRLRSKELKEQAKELEAEADRLAAVRKAQKDEVALLQSLGGMIGLPEDGSFGISTVANQLGVLARNGAQAGGDFFGTLGGGVLGGFAGLAGSTVLVILTITAMMIPSCVLIMCVYAVVNRPHATLPSKEKQPLLPTNNPP